MRLLSWLLCAAAVIIPALSSEEKSVARLKRDSSDKKIVCYYTNWSVYRPGTAKFSPQNINPYLCTHLIYAFGGLSKDNALKPFDKYQDIEQGGYAKFNGLKTYNKNLKTMLAIGGWNEGSARFSPLVADPERRKELVKNTVKFLRQNHFDGLDLDWEYPSFRDGGKPRDRDNYATLVQEFREEFERESEKTGRPRLLLTMAVPAGIEYIDKGYDVPRLNKYLDWMNILSYDYHSAFEPTINHHSPLFSLEEDDEYNFDAQLSIDYTVKHYIKLGADRNKLVLGIPTYGRSYTLFNPDATDIGSPADGPGEQGDATREKGYLAYYEICERISNGGWTEENPYPDAMGPYAYKDNQWVGYDDEGIARAKAKYVNDNDLGGIMFWSIDNDDFRGKCSGKPYPIIEAAKEALLASANELVPVNSKSSKKQDQGSSKTKTRTSRVRTKSTTTTEASKGKSSGRTTTTPQPPTTPDPGSDFVCKDEGFFPHPRDCKKYFWCLDSGPSSLGIVAHQFTCPSGLVFNKISDSCDYARNVICKNKGESSSTTTTTTTTSTTTARTTTARSRLVITASPPRTTSTTTTEPPEEEVEEEEEEEEEDEEDPGTIKELISLIKKLGGVEQLEKQLNLQNSDAKEKIKPSLYSKVLQGRTGNRYRGVTKDDSSTTQKYVSVFRNRAVGPQSSTTEETSSRGQDKPRYVTIQRNRATKKPSQFEEDSKSEEEIVEEHVQLKAKPSRRRPNLDSTTEREYVTLRRSRLPKDEEDLTTTSKYRNVVRVRSTTEAVPEEDEEITEEEEEEDGVEEQENEEDEVTEEEEARKEDADLSQKIKKYSSITRDKKLSAAAAAAVEEEEETKVSGPQGAKYEGGVDPSTTEHIPTHGRDDVNNVHRVTSPRYVEIRRTQTLTTEPSKSDVNIFHNTPESEQENKVTVEDESGTRKFEGFQSRSTTVTDAIKRLTRPPFRSSVSTETVTPSPVPVQSETQRFRGRFRSSTEGSTTPEIKSPYNKYKTINRSTSERPKIDESEVPTRFPKRERTTSTTTTTTTPNTPQVDSSTIGAQRRFQFAPRTKPTVLTPKIGRPSTTETFTITVPDLPISPITENFVGGTVSSPSFPSVTLEPTTNVPPVSNSANSDDPENEVGSTSHFRTRPSTRYYIPTTSTQTSVVTSITESLFTERGRILVSKKSRGNSKFSGHKITKIGSETETESPVETTIQPYRPTGYKTIVRSTTSTTPKPEITKDAERRRFKGKATFTSTTTTTEEPEKQERRYVPKKIRNFKKVSSTETPPTSSTTTQRARFTPRNRFRQTGQDLIESPNSLSQRFGNTRKRKIISQKDDDDLAVEQTETYFGDTFDNQRDRYLLGGEVRQTSDKDYLNAVFVFSQSTTERDKTLIQTDDHVSKEEEKDQERNTLERTLETTLAPIRSSFKNLRIRPPLKTSAEPSEKTPSTQQHNTRNTESRVNSIYRPNAPNLINSRGRTRFPNGVTPEQTSKEDTKSDSRSSERNLLTGKTTNFSFQPTKTTKPGLTVNVRGLETGNQEENAINKETKTGRTTSFTTEIDLNEPNTTNFADFGGSESIDEDRNETIIDQITPRTSTNSPGKSTVQTLRRTTILSNFRTYRTRAQQLNSTENKYNFSRDSQEKEDGGYSVPNEESYKLRFPVNNRLLTSDKSEKREDEVKEIRPSFGSGRRGQNFRKGENESKSTPSGNENFINRVKTNFRNFRIKNNQSSKLTESDVNSSPEDVSEEKITRSGNPNSAKTTEGIVSVNQYKTTRGSSTRTATGTQDSSKSTSGSSRKEASESTDEYLSDPSVGSTFGLKTGVSLGVTKSLSSPFVSTERPTTFGLTSRTLRPIVVTSADSTHDSIISSSVDSAVRIANLPPTSISSKSPTGNGKETVKHISSAASRGSPFSNAETDSSNRTEIIESQTRLKNEPDANAGNANRPNFRIFKKRKFPKGVQPGVGTGADETVKSGKEDEGGKYSKGGKRVLVRTRPIRPIGSEGNGDDQKRIRGEEAEKEEEEGDEGETEDVRTEAPPTTITTRVTSSRRGNQDHFIRSRVRSTTSTSTPSAPTTERQERRRTLLDRRRLKHDFRSTTVKPEVQPEVYSSTARSNILLRRRTRPTMSSTTTTTTTTTTTESPYLEVQEDSSLEESKTLDDSPGIQDLADPAVVAIHTLATVSPGPISSSGRPLTYFGSSPGTSDTYTLHVTPGDIESITPGKLATISPGTARPTSILTLKPFTIPVITKTQVQGSPITLRPPSPFRASGIPLVTENPFVSSDEILEQARRLEAIPKPRPAVPVTASTPRKSISIAGKSARPKPFSKVPKQEVVQSVSSPDPATDYEYYDEEDPLANIPASALKVKVHSNGYIECLDRGNFPHPFSCKKFISCAKMENNELLGWEYTCPKHLSFDPVGGICNWSAGLGCQH